MVSGGTPTRNALPKGLETISQDAAQTVEGVEKGTPPGRALGQVVEGA